MPEIFAKFYDLNPTKLEFENFLTSFPSKRLQGLSIVGWIVEDGVPNCFVWDTDRPAEVCFNSQHLRGSGAKQFEEIVRGDRIKASSASQSRVESDPYAAVCEALAQTGDAFFDQVLGEKKWGEITFGFAYEVLAYIDGGFRSARSVLYVGWDYFWDPKQRRGTASPAPFAAKFTNERNYSIIQRITHKDFSVKQVWNHLVEPAYNANMDPALIKMPFTFECDFYVHYFVLRPNLRFPFRLCVPTGSVERTEPIWIDVRAKEPRFRVDTQYLDQLFRQAGA